MKSAVIVFPGSNCDRDMAVAIEQISGSAPHMVWHRESELPQGVDLIALPGGFSYGDYLRSGAMASRSPVMAAVARAAERGAYVLGVCNGFQVLTESGLLPGALMRNAGIHFVCRDVALTVENDTSAFTRGYAKGERLTIPVAHHDGNYFADAATLDRIEGEGRVAFRYAESVNGSSRDIAGVLSENGRVLGMMPHPERAIEAAHGNEDGRRLFSGLVEGLLATA
jgi:phosphoribosylformylglycinamidine synthase subunit PurQ / glutaminase